MTTKNRRSLKDVAAMNRPIARDIMTRDVVTVPDELPVAELARILTENHILGAPVVDRKGRLIGVVSASDVIANELHVGHEVVSERDYYCRPDLGTRAEFDRLGMHVEQYADSLVRDIMTPVVISAPLDATAGELAETMAVNRIHRVIVVENGELRGVVSALDLLAYIPRSPGDPANRAAVLWATDLGPDAVRIGPQALAAARRYGGRLIILHVTPDLAALWAAYGPHPETLDLQQRLEEQSLERLNDLAKQIEQELGAIEIVARIGDPARVILAVTADRRPDLLVIGAQRPASERISGIGSVAEKVLAASPVPVMTVPGAH